MKWNSYIRLLYHSFQLQNSVGFLFQDRQYLLSKLFLLFLQCISWFFRIWNNTVAGINIGTSFFREDSRHICNQRRSDPQALWQQGAVNILIIVYYLIKGKCLKKSGESSEIHSLGKQQIVIKEIFHIISIFNNIQILKTFNIYFWNYWRKNFIFPICSF